MLEVVHTTEGALSTNEKRRNWFLNHTRGLYAHDSTLTPFTNIYISNAAKIIMASIAEAVLNGAGRGDEIVSSDGKGHGIPWKHTDYLFGVFQRWESHQQWIDDSGDVQTDPNKIVYYLDRDGRYDFTFQRFILYREEDTQEALNRWYENKTFPYPGINWDMTKKFMMPYDYNKNMEKNGDRKGYVFSMNGGLIYHGQNSAGWGIHT